MVSKEQIRKAKQIAKYLHRIEKLCDELDEVTSRTSTRWIGLDIASKLHSAEAIVCNLERKRREKNNEV